MKLLLDQGLPLSTASLLRNINIDTIHVSEIKMSESEDIEIIKWARSDGRVVVTLDADFHTLLALNSYISPSIIRIRIQKLRAYELKELLLKIIDLCRDEIDEGSAITVEQNRIRIRNLPLLPNTN